jgi:hypothetical protein
MCSSNPLACASEEAATVGVAEQVDGRAGALLTSQHAGHLGRYVSVSEVRRWRAGTATTYSMLLPPSSLHCLCGRICGSNLTSPQRLPPVQLL